MNCKMAIAVYNRTAELNHKEVAVLFALAGAAKNEKTLPSPSIKRLADRSGMAIGTAKDAIKSLSEKGIISVSKRKTASGQNCNLYSVDLAKLGRAKAEDESVENKPSRVQTCEPSRVQTCEPSRVQTCEPSRVQTCEPLPKSSEEFKRVQKSSNCGHYNNIVNNIDNNKDNNNKTDKTVDSGVKGGLGGNQPMPQKVEPPKVEPTTPHTEKPSRSVCLDDILPKEIAKMALAKLVAEGMPDQEGKERINGTWKTYLAELDTLKGRGWKKKNGEAITSANYLVGMLATMAREYKPSEPQAEEPTRLEDIFNLLKKEWEEQYPEVADRIKSFELNELHPNTESKLRAKETAGWKTVNGNRVAYVRNALEGTVYERVQGWRQDEIKDMSSCLYHVRKALAQYRIEPKSYYNPRKTVEEEIAELEEREKICHAELQRLRKLTTRPTAA